MNFVLTPRNFAAVRFPAEWEAHAATWLSWPHNPETWPGIDIGNIQDIWAQMVAALSPGEEVHINVADAKMEETARNRLQDFSVATHRIFFHHFPTNDAWVRDHGPIFIIGESAGEDQLALVDWEYNAWGGKYPPFDLDNQIPRRIADRLEIQRLETERVLEGGSIDGNGYGTLLTTESCLLNPNRNPELSKAEIETMLEHYLGVRNILWLGEGIVGDDTDGHIDDITRFVARDTVVTALTDDPQDSNYEVLQANYRKLQSMCDERGQQLNVISLPMPAPVDSDIGLLPASYANFYIANEVVLVPVFEDPQDETALEILRRCFPGRKVLGIPSRDLVKGLGGIHCVTQQQPMI